MEHLEQQSETVKRENLQWELAALRIEIPYLEEYDLFTALDRINQINTELA
jgi:hypothetical protein